MAFPIILALAFGLALLLLLVRYADNPTVLRARLERSNKSTPLLPEIDPGRFRFIVNELLEDMGLHIIHAEPLGHAGATRLVAVGRGVLRDARHIIYLEASPAGAFVDGPTLQALAEDVQHNGGSLGVVVTPCEIDRTGVAGMSVDLELIDGRALLGLINKHLPARAVEMRGYRLADAGIRGRPSHWHDRVGPSCVASAKG